MAKFNGYTVNPVNYSLIEKANQMKNRNEGQKFNPRFEILDPHGVRVAVIDTRFFWKEGKLFYYNWVFVDSNYEFEQTLAYSVATKYVNSAEFEFQLKKFEHECTKAYFELNKKSEYASIESFISEAPFRWSIGY